VPKHRKRPARAAKSPPVTVSLAPLAHVVAAARIPLPATDEREEPYLWLAGIAFAVLAAAGLTLHMLSVMYFRLEFE
jgi:hypothetical protein